MVEMASTVDGGWMVAASGRAARRPAVVTLGFVLALWGERLRVES